MIKGIHITEQDFSIEAVCTNMRATHAAALGALVTFTGLVRERNPAHKTQSGPPKDEDTPVASLTLEHYPGMTEASIATILAKAEAQWPLLEVQVIHRIGTMAPTEQIVLVAVASAHRDAAFAAAEFVMDYLKTDAVFWKKEQTQHGTRWVQSTDNDRLRARKWQDDQKAHR